MQKYYIIKTTFKNKKEAKNLANLLLEKRLIACAQISKIESIYVFNNTINEDNEYQLSLKTKQDNYQKIEELIIKNHSYEVPQILAIEVKEGSKDYLDWIDAS